LAFAIARSGLVSKWAALPFGLAYYLCGWIIPIVTLVGGFLMIVVGAWIAIQLNREAVSPATSARTESDGPSGGLQAAANHSG
jgi:hypothetical protein